MSDTKKGKHWLKPSEKYSTEYKTVYVNACGYKSMNSTTDQKQVTCKNCIKLIKAVK